MNAAKKQKPVWGDALVALVILAVAVWSLFVLPTQRGDQLTVVATVDGNTVWTCSLDNLSEPALYTVEGEYLLTLEVSENGVRVIETSCPGEDCRYTGLISQTGQQIVCLPNRTVVTLKGNDSHYDAVTG